jgi:hypothetical protein
VVQVAVLDRAALEAYQRRKPGRFRRLKEVAHSPPFPPIIFAAYGRALDEGRLQRFQRGLLEAADKERTRAALVFLRLTRFDPVPPDLERVLATTRQTYPSTKTMQPSSACSTRPKPGCPFACWPLVTCPSTGTRCFGHSQTGPCRVAPLADIEPCTNEAARSRSGEPSRTAGTQGA